MPRTLLVLTLQLTAIFLCRPVWAARGELLSDTVAAQHGLVRPWFTQVQLDQSRGRLINLVLYEGTLYAQTDRSVIHAIDAETGKTLWWKQVGDPLHPSMTPDANRDWLAVINGSDVYVLNRYNGDVLYQKEVDGAPGAGPALSAKRVYVPMNTGMLMAYRLNPVVDAKIDANGDGKDVKADTKAEAEKPKVELTAEEKAQIEAERRRNLRIGKESVSPMFCQSYGKALVQPLVTRENLKEEYVVWPTDRGLLNLARVDRSAENNLSMKYRLETSAAIVGRPDYLPPDPKVTGDSGLIVVASRDGFVYAVQEKTGELLWRFSVGEPIIESPAVVDDRVYVSAQTGGMYCLAVKTGKDVWFAPDIIQFVAASKDRVYATDRIGRLAVLNAQSGARLGVLPVETTPIKLMNSDTDRIYLADPSGLIQCLHEVELSEPIIHGLDRKQASEAEAVEEKPATQPKEVKEKPAKKENVAPKEPAAPRERPKKASKKAAADAAFGDAAAQPGDAVGPGGAAAGKANKAKKAQPAAGF